MASGSAILPRSLGHLRGALRFLRRNYRLAALWPIAAVIIAGVGWHLLLRDLDHRRQAIEQGALAKTEALAAGYAEQVRRRTQDIDQLALHVRYDWQLSGGRLRLDDAIQQGLFPPASEVFVAVVDRNDMLITGTLPTPQRRFLGNTADFLAQKDAKTDFLYIGKPFVGPVSRRVTIPFSRRLQNRDGSFGGIVVVSVAPAYLTSSYSEDVFGDHGLVGVIGTDGVVRAMRGGETDSPYTPLIQPPPQFATQKAGSMFLAGYEWFSDRRNRYVGWHAIDGYPLVAIAALDRSEVLASYRADRAAGLRTAVGATLALAAFALIAMTLSLRLAWRKHELETVQLAYRMATEGGSEGFYIARPIRDASGAIVDFMAIDCNYRGAELLGLRREDLLGQNISRIYPASTLELRLALFRRAMEVGRYETELEEPEDSPILPRWVHLKAVRSGGDLAITLRDIGDVKKHMAELERRSNYDTLTGLPNRQWVNTHLPDVIRQADANKTMLAVLFIDLDGFKAVNDTMGHAAGDEVLRSAARRLKEAIRPNDWAARLGGDEFVVVVEHIAQKVDAAHVAERIVQAFKDGFRFSKGVHSVGASVGISLFPSDGRDADTLLHHADIAMYSVKTGRKGSFRFFDQKFYDAVRARHDQEAELRHAIEHDQFVMLYQPRVDISTGTTSSMEALVRWAHPTRGLISPVEFIPLAEETGLIVGLGELVIEKVCAQLARWGESGQTLVPVSVNVSPRQFNEADIAKLFSTYLGRYGVDPALIEIELTESSMMGDGGDIAGALAAIQKMGIKLLVDDFGTGYSSLSQLQRLDFDVLKVDRAFTSGLERTGEGNIFFKAIITMAHALGMRVVAEGVETLEQIRILKSLKCDEIQGFYISRPIAPSAAQPVLPRWYFPSMS